MGGAGWRDKSDGLAPKRARGDTHLAWQRVNLEDRLEALHLALREGLPTPPFLCGGVADDAVGLTRLAVHVRISIVRHGRRVAPAACH